MRRSPVHLGPANPVTDPAKAASQKLHFEPLAADMHGKPRVGVRLVSGTPTPTNSLDSQSHGSADTAAAGHAVHSRPAPAPSPGPADYHHPIAHEDTTPPLFKSAPVAQQEQQSAVVMPSKLGMKLAKMEAQGGAAAGSIWGHPQQQLHQALHLEHEQPRTPPRHAALLSSAEQRLGSLAEAAEALEGGRRGFQPGGPDLADGDRGEDHAVAGPFVKALDYKSCDHILCLTKDMARELFPPAPHSSAGELAVCCMAL